MIDASVAMAWHFVDERGAWALELLDRTLEHGVVVPGHWWGEIANALLMGERRRRATTRQSSELVALIEQLDIETEHGHENRALDRVLPLARAHALTVYDAAYLELAERRGLPLATLDRDLAEAARAVGVELVA